MKRIGIGLMALVLSGLPVFAEDARTQLAETLLERLDMKANFDKSFEMVRQMMPRQMEQMQKMGGQTNDPAKAAAHMDKVLVMMQEEFGWEKMKGDLVTMFAETFTEQELKDIAAFYDTPAGKSFIAKQPELMKKSMELNQKMMMQIMPRMQALTRELAAEAKVKAPGP